MRSVCAIACCLAALSCAAAQQSPRSPESERSTFQLADPNLVVELVAAEPNVRAPVALAWSPAGDMFVAEMTDYPSGPVSGRIRLLEDLNADGLYERATIFATNIAFPNGVLPWRGGILVTAAPDIWFLADTNGDRVADVRRKVLTGFAEGNEQLRVNGLFWGVDNWIYGANGRSDGDARWSDGRAAGSIRRRDFRFRPDTHQFEAVAGHSQFGMGHDDWGNRFPVFNNNPVRHVVMEDRWIERQPLLAGTEVVASISPASDGTRIFALTPPALLIPQPVGFYTSACGPTVYRGTALPAEYNGNAFICEPVQNVVQRRILVPEAATFVAKYAHTNSEFLASIDPWFHGVFTATGPDGALYIVDMYREWVEHPHWVAPEIRDKVDWRKGEEHGRIWRVRARDAKRPAPLNLALASERELVQALESPNGWVRDTAHQRLFEKGATSMVAELRRVARKSPLPQARIHALHLASVLGPGDHEWLSDLLADEHPRVRENAAVALGAVKQLSEESIHAIVDRARQETDARTRMQLACLMSGIADLELRRKALSGLCSRGNLDDWIITAVLAGAGERPWLVLKPIANGRAALEERLIERFAPVIAASGERADGNEFLAWLATGNSRGRLSAFNAFASHPRASAVLKAAGEESLAPFRREAVQLATSRTSDPPQRIAAIQVLARTSAGESKRVLPQLLDPAEPEVVQSAAARALLDLNDPAVTQGIFAQWSALPRGTRQQLLGSAARQPTAATALLASIEKGSVSVIEVDATTRQGIQRLQNADVKRMAEKAFAAAVDNDREQVIQKYKPALSLAAERKRGAVVFEKNCAVCHQMQGLGTAVGPDLSGIGTQTRESLLMQILDPSRQVLPDYVAYNADTKSGESYTGFIANETAATVTLRRANEPDITLKRSDLVDFRTSGKSVMPDGLEAAIGVQEMADLIEFLRRPDRTLFTELKKSN